MHPGGSSLILSPPFKNGAIDGTGLERLLARVLPHAQALLLAGPRHGEGERMEMAMRDELLKKAMDAATGRPIPLFVWVSGNTETQTRNNILALQERFGENPPEGGLFWADTPLAYHSNRGLPDYYRELQTILTVPLVLHNDPGLCAYHPNF